MNIRILFVTIFYFFYSFTYAQMFTATVVDASTNTPLPGANVSLQGKPVTITDADGRFSVSCIKNSRVTVSFIGFDTYNHIVKNCEEPFTIALVPSTNKLTEVEITTTASSNKSVLYQPVSITRLGDVELKRGTGVFIDEAINANITGVTMQRRSVAGGQQFNIRGYGNGVRGTNGLNSNFDGQGYKVYLNGIPVTDAEGITVMDDIDFGSIGNVEITKGPAGTLYGLAIAGVVNLTTTKAEKGQTSIGQDVQVGSYGLQRFTTRFQTATERSSLLVNYGHQKSDGFMSHSASRKNFVNVIGQFQPADKQSVQAYVGYSNSYDERGGELTIAQYNSRDYSGNPEYIKRNAHSQVISFRAGLGHTYHFSENIDNTTSVFGAAASTNASSAGGWTDKTPLNYGLRSVFNFNFDFNNGYGLNGVAGAEAQEQRAQTIGYNMIANASNPTGYYIIEAMKSNQSTYSGTSSLFTEWTLNMPKDFSITAGIGYSNMSITLNDRFYVNNNLPKTFDTSYAGMFSPHVAVNKVFNKALSIYASYSTGYKAPVSSYFYIPATGKVNGGLKPEVGRQFELGTKGTLMNTRLLYDVALFKTMFSDKMYAVAVPLNGSANTTAYTYIANGGKQDHQGVEAEVKYIAYQSARSFFKSIKPFANVTWSHFRYEDYSFQRIKPGSNSTKVDTFHYNDKPVAGVPKIATNAGVDVMTTIGLYANAIYSYRDKMPISSDGLNYTSSYNLLNAKLGYRQSIRNHFDVDLYLGVNNITGVQYPLMVFVNQLPDAYLPAPLKANYFGGVNVKYSF